MEPGPLNRLISHAGHAALTAAFVGAGLGLGRIVLAVSGSETMALASVAALGGVVAYAMRERTEAEIKARDKQLSLFDWSPNPHALAGVGWSAAGAAGALALAWALVP